MERPKKKKFGGNMNRPRALHNNLRAAIAIAMASTIPLSLPVIAAEEIEEIVVTGSYIKRKDSFDMSSPVDVMSETQLAEQGTPNLGDVLRNTTYNFGVESVGNILAANPQTAGLQQANFRGLGAGATLTVLDGRRTVQGNLANTYPQLMIARTESLTDGGATLYGTDAVGGVFNIIPKKDYEGFEVMAGTQQADDYFHDSYSFIAGGQGDSSGFVIAGEHREQDALHFYERPEYYLGSASYSSTSWPGDFRVANRDATGAITTTSNRTDPGCGQNNATEVNGVSVDANGDGTIDAHEQKAAGIPAYRQGFAVGSCRWQFGSNFDYFDEFTADSLASNYTFDLNDRITVSGELMWTSRNTISRGSPSNPGGRQPELTAVPGDNPGNPYRAFYDADADGRYETADGDLLLYAVDANGDGVPDRDPAGTDADANGMADVLVAGTDPTTGIAFNEDVQFVDWRPVGYPFVGPSRLNEDGTSNGAANGKLRTIRSVTQVDYDINDNWSGFSSVVWSELVSQLGGRGESLSAIQQGIEGSLLVRDEPNATSKRAWFNPFTTQNYACVNRDCGGGVLQTDPDQINNAAVYDLIAYDDPDVITVTSMIFESVLTGDLMKLGAGMVQAAVGIQFRDEEYDVDANIVSNSLDVWIGVGQPDYVVERQTTAFFGEVRLPFTDTLEVDASIRHEAVDDASTEDLDHTDYRLGVNFVPVDNMSFRASYNTAFIAPTLEALYSPSTLQGLSQVSDPFLGTAAFVARTTGGSITLRPEEAEIFNVGFTLLFLEDDLRIDFDYKYFDFTDRIIRPAAQEVLLEDAARATAAGYSLDAAGLAGWQVDAANTQVVSRGPISGEIQLVLTDQVNAQNMEWEGFDMGVSYNMNTDYGEFNVGVDTTYTLAYDYTSITGVVTEGAGKRNNNTAAVPTTPELRANFRTSWRKGMHNVTVYGRYFSEVEDVLVGDPFAVFCGAASGAAGLFGINSATHCPTSYDAHLTWDVQYSVDLDDILKDGMKTNIQVGVINLLDEKAPPHITLGGLETSLFDPRDQMLYARVKVGF
jgi:iron complex outermembrane receptor protein